MEVTLQQQLRRLEIMQQSSGRYRAHMDKRLLAVVILEMECVAGSLVCFAALHMAASAVRTHVLRAVWPSKARASGVNKQQAKYATNTVKEGSQQESTEKAESTLRSPHRLTRQRS